MFGNLGVSELILILFVLLPTVLWIVALIDIVKSDFQGYNKIIWVLVVIFLPVIGAILYFVIGKSQKISG
jgi:hypothetical protein